MLEVICSFHLLSTLLSPEAYKEFMVVTCRATDLDGGSLFGYKLLVVILLSNFAAMFLQSLSLKLGVVAERDLAQACRDAYPKVGL